MNRSALIMSAFYGGDGVLGAQVVKDFCPTLEHDINLVKESEDALHAIAPIDPLTGWPTNCLTTLISGSPELQQLCASILQRVPQGSSPSSLTDDELLNMLPSRYAQSFNDCDLLRTYLEEYSKDIPEPIVSNDTTSVNPEPSTSMVSSE